MRKLPAPFPYIGTKHRVAEDVWERFGNVQHYIEPFAGGLAVLLGRPENHFFGKIPIETVNDKNCYIVNAWRAIQRAPEEVASWADAPVFEVDLHAKRRWIYNEVPTDFNDRMQSDPDYYDAKIAGWWVWVVSTCVPGNEDLQTQGDRPNLSCFGFGVHRATIGVPTNSDTCLGRRQYLINYMRKIQDRLRFVRILCGDWKRTVTTLDSYLSTGVFLDPPYSTDQAGEWYPEKWSPDTALEVFNWCLEHGKNTTRVALCGYKGEYEMPDDWEEFVWKPMGIPIHQSSVARTERIWFSPNCLHPKHGFSFT